jgi:hypothetical protein
MLLLIVRYLDAVSVGTALVGIGIALYTARDNHRDLLAFRARGQNGYAELTVLMGIRSAHSTAVLHGVLGVISALGFLGTPPPSRIGFAIVFYLGYLLAQGWAVRSQIRNQLDRVHLRRKLGER